MGGRPNLTDKKNKTENKTKFGHLIIFYAPQNFVLILALLQFEVPKHIKKFAIFTLSCVFKLAQRDFNQSIYYIVGTTAEAANIPAL